MKLVFVHIPKCCGRTFIEAIKAQCEFQNIGYYYGSAASKATWDIHWQADRMTHRKELLRNEQFLVQYFLRRQCDFVYGHIPFSPLAHDHYRGIYNWITILRDPVDRFISNVIYVSLVMGKGGISAVENGDRDPRDLIYRILSDEEHCKLIAQSMTIQLGGLSYDLRIDIDSALETAKTSLGNFDIVGFQDDIPSFVSRFENKFQTKLEMAPKHQLSSFITDNDKVDQLKECFTEEIIRKIKFWSERDIELYDYAKRLVS